MTPTIEQNYALWLASKEVSADEKKQIASYTVFEREDAFFKDVEFGTAGMRGILGPGTNRINRFTVGRATVAMGLYLQQAFPGRALSGVVIAHDNRHQSRTLTLLVAGILNRMGFRSFIFNDLRPTPELSFAVRTQKAIGGIMITASHNPKEYNGFKVYDENGCQLTPQKLTPLLKILATLPEPLSVKVPAALTIEKTIELPLTLDDEYLRRVEGIQVNPSLDKKDFNIVFSPQHGASYDLAPRLYKKLGYRVHVVAKQAKPDPDFSGTLSPNPEEEKAYIESYALAKTVNADLILMADPDADRVGLAFKTRRGDYQRLTGNLSAALLAYYLFSEKKKKGLLSSNGVMYDTIVCSPLAAQIAQSFGVKVETFLTGFKFIGDRIDFYERMAGPTFEFGYEESYGCLIQPFVRDKDAIQALLMYAEMTLFYKGQHRYLDEVLTELYERFGYRVDRQFAQEFKGPEGAEQMKRLMTSLRANPFKKVARFSVLKVDDYLTQLSKTPEGNTAINQPASDVLKFHLEDGSTISVRPSGTEPKCKIYYSITGKTSAESEEKYQLIHGAFLRDHRLV